MSDALNLVQEIAKNKAGVELFSIYKGIPYINQAQFTNRQVDPTATLHTHPHQLVCIRSNGSVIMRSNICSEQIRAYPCRLDFSTNEITFNRFELLRAPICDRKSVRVAPAADTSVMVHSLSRATAETQGCLEDVSSGGAGLRIHEPGWAVFRSGDIILMSFDLPGEGDHLNPYDFSGEIRYVQPSGDKKYVRLGVETISDKSTRYRLFNYINRRHNEILIEIENLSTIQTIP